MYIWNVTLYEPSPVNGDGVRPMRSGMLSQALCDAGHEVELWMPGFEHVHHEHYRKESCFEKVVDGYWIQYIKGCGYKSDVSLMRFLHNKQVAKEFFHLASHRVKMPDLLFTQVPSLELAEVVVNFAREKNIPVIVDVRDLWPDVYARLFPKWCKFLYGLMFRVEQQRAVRVFTSATAVVAVSESYLKWGVEKAERKISKNDGAFNIGYALPSFINTTQLEGHSILNIEKKRDEIFVSFAGTFCSSYDLLNIIVTARILEENKINNIKFIIAGTGERENWLRKKAINLSNVLFVGWLSNNDMLQLLHITDIGLAPYAQGALMSLPNKPFEYMAASLPILTSLDGELHQLIVEKDIGKYYTAGNAKELVDCLLFFRDNPKIMQEMGKRAKKVFDLEFRSDLIYPKFVKHLEMIMLQHGVNNV